MLVLSMNFSFAQEKLLSGKVVDQDNIPLPGVSVLVVGTTRGAQTDFDGNYSILVSEGETLRFSYLGMSPVERLVGRENSMDIQMEVSAEMLEEVVLVGYGSGQNKNRVASSISTLSSEALEARPNASFVQSLQGQIPGVQIAAISGQPGDNSTVLVRGLTSLSGNIEPLFIMDGVPIDENNFRSLNPTSNPSTCSKMDLPLHSMETGALPGSWSSKRNRLTTIPDSTLPTGPKRGLPRHRTRISI